MQLPQDLKDFIELLNLKNCRYLIVGGWAFNYYADARPTGDFDFFVPIDEQSEVGLREVLSEFGFSSALPAKGSPLLQSGKVLMLGRKPMRIDLLTAIDGVKFDEAWASKVSGDLGGSPVFYISKALLLANKLASGRDKDLRDAAVLKSLYGE